MTTSMGRAVGAAVVATAAAVAVFGAQTVWDTVTGWFTGGTEIIGDGEYSFMVASGDKSQVEKCSVQQVIQDKTCDGLRVVVFDAGKMPFITRGIGEAWDSGLPALLTMNRGKTTANRKVACGSARFTRQYAKTSCDEYPMAATEEGGENAHVEEVPERENWCQGGTVRPQYPRDGEYFIVVITSPKKIAPNPYDGHLTGTEDTCLS